ncbi:MAG: acyl-CoA desaturase [Vicingaceae bacterium]
MIHYKFSRNSDKDFARVLRQRVNAYFEEASIGKNANGQMVTKTIIALSLYLLPYIVIMTAGISNLYIIFGLWALAGLGKAIVGTTVMHDSVHGSYSKNQSINKIMSISAPLLGVSGKVWKFQHNVLHHTYTNIEHADEDISPRFVLRFSPHQPKYWFHRYQWLYVPIIYGVSTMIWVFTKDYFKMAHYKEMGLVKTGKEYNLYILGMTVRKLIYLFFALALPYMVLGVSFGLIFLMFATMHFVAGISLSLIFQPAHVIEDADFIEQEEAQIDRGWWAHQLYTTSNFAVKNKFITWVTGGLNHQVEHHLFPNICHIHYPKIASIVRETAAEFNLPYYAQESFVGAVGSHFKMLRLLGRP